MPKSVALAAYGRLKQEIMLCRTVYIIRQFKQVHSDSGSILDEFSYGVLLLMKHFQFATTLIHASVWND